MPWPPTGALDDGWGLMDLGAQIGEAATPGVGDTSGDPAAEPVQDPMSGLLAPGVTTPTDDMFSAFPDPEENRVYEKVPTDKKRQLVIDYASEKIDMNYVWGGASDAAGGYDCSGLLFYAFRKAGIDMPRVSWSQAARGKRVPIKSLQPGDLIAWDHNPNDGGADHIALWLGDGWILEAPKTGLKIRKRKLGANEGAWGVHLDY